MEKIIVLIGLHFIADFSLQNDFQAKFKGTNYYIMIVHCFIWAFVISCGLEYLDLLEGWETPFLFVGHILIDSWKCNREDKSKALTEDLYIDQFLHLIQLFIVLLF